MNDEKLFKLILKNKFKIITKKFIYDVQILKTKYLQMIKDTDISLLCLILIISKY